MRNCVFLALIILCAAACGPIVPATTPPQLNHTPGAPVIVTWDTYTASEFSAHYPSGWTVITSPAFSTTWVVFTSPDEQAVIVLALDPNDTQVMPPQESDRSLQRESVEIPLNDGRTLTAVLAAPSDKGQVFRPVFEQMIASVQ